MEFHHEQSPISIFKVDFHCSEDCPDNVKKRLLRFSGVESISIDAKEGMVTVTGKMNPMILVKLLRKMGQRAELWSFQKEPMHAQSYSRRNLNSHCCCDHDSCDDDDSSGSDDNDCKKTNNLTCGQAPQFKGTYSKKSKKKGGFWKKWMGFGHYFVGPRCWTKSPRRPKNFPAPPPITPCSPLMRLQGSMTYAKPPSMFANQGSSCGYYQHVSPHVRQFWG